MTKGGKDMRRLLLLMLMSLVLLALPALAAEDIDKAKELAQKNNISQEDLVALGNKLFHTEGTNTCVYCHGEGGHGGNQTGAADLRYPKTWRSYQALGGDEAMQKDREAFLNEMETALVYLIANGAPTWNRMFDRTHKNIKYDWSKVTVPDKADKYNNMMKGVTAGPMRKHVNELVKDQYKVGARDARDLAAYAALQYVKTLDAGGEQGGVFKKSEE
jgi:mono/diheme cytochrome c family protein